MLTTPNNKTIFAVFFLLLVLNNQHRHRHRHHVMALVCLQPLTASSQLRLQTLERMRGSTSQSTAAAAGGSSWLLDCTRRTTMASKEEQPQQHTPSLSLLGDGASYSNMSSEAAGSHDDFWPAAVEKFLSNLEHATRTAWLKLSPEFFDLFQQRAAEYLSSSSSSSANDPYGPRWAIANTGIDLSGTWIPIVTSDFKQAFDSFLSTCCGQFYPYFRRKIMVNFLGLTKEVIQQHQMGRTLEIVSSNPVGQWNRTLVASGTRSSRKGGRTNRSTTTTTDAMFFVPIYQTVQDPEGDMVEIEAWWENGGTVHRSWLRGIPHATSSNTNHKDKNKHKVKANGIFESRRYLESRNVLVCESTFHPSTTASRSIQMARVVWRYSRAN